MSQDVVYDAFVLCAFPALAIMGAFGFNLLYKIPINKKIITSILIGILLLGCYNQLVYSNTLIKGKVDSYLQVKQAGLWIKDNSNVTDIVFSTSLPQNTYYSERETHSPHEVNTSEKLLNLIKEKHATFFIDSIFETRMAHVPEFVSKYQDILIPLKAYFIDPQQQSPALVIYSINYSKI
jgi:hypothetical protein